MHLSREKQTSAHEAKSPQYKHPESKNCILSVLKGFAFLCRGVNLPFIDSELSPLDVVP
jgi:hypothetical protein